MGKEWQWQEISASRAISENAARLVLEANQSGKPPILLSAARAKLISTRRRRFDFKFGQRTNGWRVLIRVDLYHAGFLGWLPLYAFSIWQTSVEERGSLDLYAFGYDLRPMRIIPDSVQFLRIEEKFLADPLPRGFAL